MESADARFVRDAFWIALGREVKPVELRDNVREIQASGREAFLQRLIASAEFRGVSAELKDGSLDRAVLDALEQALRAIGSSDYFVTLAYELLLGRPADESGKAHYASALASGDPHWTVLASLLRSEEFERHFRDVSPQGGFLPRDVQLCELANPAKWDNPEWMQLLQDLKVVSDEKSAMHRKSYEFTQLLYGLYRLKFLREDVRVLSVGAGHEPILFWLANHVGLVVATDLYEEGRWDACGDMEGDQRVIRRPEDYAPFSYRRDRLAFLQMDGRRLAFRDAAFDVAYSLSSVEHFGGVSGAARAVDEMARTLKPGGLLALATEYRLSGTHHDEVFEPEDVHALSARPGLQLVQPIDERVYQRYDYVPVDLYKNRFQTPHMVVRMGETVFTTVMLFLQKT
jgi:SAM-dependent methyltransferase